MVKQEQRAEPPLNDEALGRALKNFLIDFKGISVPKVADLRKSVREDVVSNSTYVVVKNTLALIAVRDSPLFGIERDKLRLKLIAILKTIHTRRHAMQQQMEQLIDVMMPAATVPLPPQVLQARRNAAARDALLREFGAMTSAQIGENAGSRSPNRAALAHRWKSDGRIFAVPHHGANYFPGFQFKENGQPLEVIPQIIRILGDKRAPWELALWFAANNGWLGAQRPVDLLVDDPSSVVIAAEREAEDRLF